MFFPPGCTPSVSPPGCHVELDQAIAALATALSQACGPPTGALRKVNIWGNHSLTVCRLIRRTGTHAHTLITHSHPYTHVYMCITHTIHTHMHVCTAHSHTHSHPFTHVCTCITHTHTQSHACSHSAHSHSPHTHIHTFVCARALHTGSHIPGPQVRGLCSGCPCSIASEPPPRSVLETMPHHLLACLASRRTLKRGLAPSSC